MDPAEVDRRILRCLAFKGEVARNTIDTVLAELLWSGMTKEEAEASALRLFNAGLIRRQGNRYYVAPVE